MVPTWSSTPMDGRRDRTDDYRRCGGVSRHRAWISQRAVSAGDRLRADEPLALDRDAAEVLAAWYGFTAEVLELFATEIADAILRSSSCGPNTSIRPSTPRTQTRRRRANYGASPGDEGHPEPYMYVGPWGTPAADPFWNAATFNGAVLPLAQVVDEKDPTEVGLRFLRRGRKCFHPPTCEIRDPI